MNDEKADKEDSRVSITDLG